MPMRNTIGQMQNINNQQMVKKEEGEDAGCQNFKTDVQWTHQPDAVANFI